MKDTSLKEAIQVILEALEKTEMDELDKVELMMNLDKFLENYHQNILILNKKYSH